MASPIIAVKKLSFETSHFGLYKNIVSNMNDQWLSYFSDDKSYLIEKYQSIIPTTITERPEELTDQLIILGIERIDLPKLPNGKPVKWWFLVQQYSCKSCIFFSELQQPDRTRKCKNPKVTDDAFTLTVENKQKCDEWFVGIDETRINQEKSWGFNEHTYMMAGLIKMGLASENYGKNLPAIGNVEAYMFNLALAEAADMSNSYIFYYLQAYFIKQAGFSIDNAMIIKNPVDFLPEIFGEPFIPQDQLTSQADKYGSITSNSLREKNGVNS